MSTPKPPGGPKGPKAFLGDADLFSELDAWDETFDALHGGSEARRLVEPEPPPLEWPTSLDAVGDVTATAHAVPGDPNVTVDEDPAFETPYETELEDDPLAAASLDPDAIEEDSLGQDPLAAASLDDDPLTDELQIDSATEQRLNATRYSQAAGDELDGLNSDETDFSEVGAEQRASALGSLLGARAIISSNTDDADPTRVRRNTPTRPPNDEDDGVYTSASRPNRTTGEPGFELDPLVPPPKPVRRTPAIIRRVSAPVEVPRTEEVTPPHGTDVSAMMDLHTRVADPGEIERGARTAAPPMYDDDYADIEIDADAGPAAVEQAPEPVLRRTAHVVRRTAEILTRPPPTGRISVLHDSSPIVKIEIEDASGGTSSPPTGGEDDFADVAAAFGAPGPSSRAAAVTRPPPIDDFAFDLEADLPPMAGQGDAAGIEERGDERTDDPVDDGLPDLEGHPAGDTLGDPVQDGAGRDDVVANAGARPDVELAPELASDLGAEPDDDRDGDPGSDDDHDEPPGRAAATLSDSPRSLPIRTSAPTSEPGSGPRRLPTLQADVGRRVRTASTSMPALADRYPRIKTPTSVPPLGQGLAMLHPGLEQPPRRETPLPPELGGAAPVEPALDLEQAGRAWPEQVDPIPTAQLDELAAAALLVYEREVATLDDSASSAALRIEAGRLCERLHDVERARTHYDAALLADPRTTAALRGLRRLARGSGDLDEATRHLDAELAVAGALERRPLGHYRIDLLMASGEQDLARVAVGEMLDAAPSDVRALLAHLELAFLDGRADEFGAALEQLAHAVTDPQLRAAVQAARGALAAQHGDTAAAGSWLAAAAESDPSALAARLGAIRYAAAQSQGEAAARELVELGRQVEQADPITAAAVAIRAQQWTTGEVGFEAAQLAISAAPSDPLVARLAAETVATDPAAAAEAFSRWAAAAATPTERAYASARAAELDHARGAELWASVLSIDPDDDYAAAQLRTAHVAEDASQASIDVDMAVAADAERDRARLRAAYGMIALGQLDAAIEVLAQGRAARPTSLAIAEALGEALAAAGKWTERAKLFAELADEPGEQLDQNVARLRSALAWEEAVGAASATAEGPVTDELAATTRAALEAWTSVLERDPRSPGAHAAAIVLASRLGDREAFSEVLARAQAAERSEWAAASLGLRRARLLASDGSAAEGILRDLQPADDPRRTLALLFFAARKGDLGEASLALEDRATLLDAAKAGSEIAALRLRSAQLALDDGDAPRATRLLQQVEQALPHLGVIPDLLAAARRRAGDRPTASARTADVAAGASSADAFARVIRDADLAAAQGDDAAALALYQRALEIRPGDPVATLPMIRTAVQLRETGPITSLGLAQLRVAEEASDGAAKAMAYELLAMIDGELRGEPGSAQIALESAAQADPTRIDLMQRLERHYAETDQIGELLRLRKAELDTVGPEYGRDRAAMQLDIAGLATREDRPELELADLYRAVLQTDPLTRLALLHLEAIVRRAGASEELAMLEENIASYFDGDAKTQAAFWTRAGETLAEIGKIDEAVQRFGRAETALPGHVPALEGWRLAALKGELWTDVADAASRQAAGTEDLAQRAALYHYAGVALMDKALVGPQAAVAFRRALEAEPKHHDAFIRLRILLEEDARHDDLGTLLAGRLAVEDAGLARIELHRALAELHRNFLSDRETAKYHYRQILDADANDLRAHAAIADIAWELGNWQEAADALMARARLERQPEVLKTLCSRLGLIYADKLLDVPMALKAFQRALTYQPDDENALVRLADLATQAGEWKLALGACERLVKNEEDPEKRAAHLQRVARIFKTGFGDTKRAERALNLALDGAPTSDDALQALVAFYQEARDTASVRIHLNRVAGAMRARAAKDPLDGVAYRVVSRAMAARATTGVAGSRPIARAAAELADLLGTAEPPEQRLLAETSAPDVSLLGKPDADEMLFPRGVQQELRQMFQLLGDRIAKHVGVDLRPYGATRGDRLRARDNPVASVAQSVATGLGFTGEIDVYVSNRQPWVMVAEPTSPVSLVIGSAIASAGGDAIRFAAGGALKLAQASLAIPARLPLDDLGVLVIALLRLFQPEFPGLAVDADAVAAQLQKLRRLIPSSLMNELRPFALAIDAGQFGHRELARDLRITGLRAGLVASGSLLAGLRILAAQAQGELPGFLADPVAQALVSFALSEDHAAVAR